MIVNTILVYELICIVGPPDAGETSPTLRSSFLANPNLDPEAATGKLWLTNLGLFRHQKTHACKPLYRFELSCDFKQPPPRGQVAFRDRQVYDICPVSGSLVSL